MTTLLGLDHEPSEELLHLGRRHGDVEVLAVDPAHRPDGGHLWFLRIDRCPHEVWEHLAGAWAGYDLEVHDGPAVDVAAGVGVRKITLHRRRQDVAPAEYRRRYLAHRAIADVHHPLASRYRQNVVVGVRGPAARTTDGVSELWYPTIEDAVDRHYGRADSRSAVRADTSEWIDVPDVRSHVAQVVG